MRWRIFLHPNAISKNVHSVAVRVSAFLHRQDPQRTFSPWRPKFACPPVGERRRGRVVVKPIMPGERVTLARITVNGSVRLTGERCFDLSLCRLGDEFVLFTEVHQQGSAQPANLAEIFFGVATMVSNRCIDLIAGGYDKSHQRAE